MQYAVHPLNIQLVVVVRGLKKQQAAALTNFVGCFILALSYFSLLLLSALNDLTGPSAGPLARTTYYIPFNIQSNLFYKLGSKCLDYQTYISEKSAIGTARFIFTQIVVLIAIHI